MAKIGKNVIVEAALDASTLAVRLTWADGNFTRAHFDNIAGKAIPNP
jgi:hypothetical protein